MPTEIKPLFRPDAFRPKLGSFVVPARCESASNQLTNWADLLGSKRAEEMKETELLADFIRDVFVDLLGCLPLPAVPCTLKREALVKMDGKFADARLGITGTDYPRALFGSHRLHPEEVGVMAWLLFLDESGHDHKQMPYEVRGGIALQDSQLWPFALAMQRLERDAFGCSLAEYQKELKGSTLLDKKRFKFANQAASMSTAARQKHCRAFLTKGLQKSNPSSEEFCAYGQACIEMARGVFQLLRDHKAVLFASAIPRGSGKNPGTPIEDYLRKDHVFLLERFFYFLEGQKQNGLLVMDAVEKKSDRRFVRQMEAYFTKTATGRYRTQWIVPTPFFVSSDMAYPVQSADLCIYCVNWCFRLPSQGMNEPIREEIRFEFVDWLRDLQYRGEGYRDGKVFESWRIFFVPNPCGAGRA